MENRIIIVGPAPYLIGKELGEYIDSFDTVVRVNRGHSLINDSLNYGSRTDILYHCMSQSKEDGGPFPDVGRLVGAIPLLTNDDKSSIGSNQHHYDLPKHITDRLTQVDKDWYIELEKRFDTRPNTGVVAIFDIIENHNPEQLVITGFTLFKDVYTKDYRERIDGVEVDSETGGKKLVLDRMNKSKNHNQYKIWLRYKDLLKLDNVIMDKELIDILSMEFDNEQDFYKYLWT